ncbi:hypothetical protein OCGS_1917 [Oceaniovalibus guishaninsula JLT2003]|uniref:Ceramidase n=1 Tax=Oceaniovalibus guishaninsula JLT2003 TaxID=1231392 RepID=K2GMI2_9RHOB|nr:ceramidase domain-containing protein [Oceaniovalibus guishaninsula]EKE43936.1 hypothetical protein OCGS_1917 [Oceaniovalibus guishaninsula JLT2003]
MTWTDPIDAYCERLGPGYWAEPVNALTNLAFIVVALWLWRRAEGAERVLCLLLLAIGVGSWLFHTHATPWAAAADTLPILAFILTYLWVANRRLLYWPAWGATLGAAAFVPYALAAAMAFDLLPFFDISAVYWPLPLLIVAYGIVLRRRMPGVAKGFWAGAAILSVSLVFRSLDGAVCPAFPMGTHFAWHLCNAVMLGWMITVLRRHRLDATGTWR